MTNSLTEAANAFGETLPAINDDVSIIEASPFPTATIPWSWKIMKETFRSEKKWGKVRGMANKL
uniref:Uncharacterized protein n=1 Tax=Romanomermis culicivorax TaxID=13658 RepID=A0A915HNV0_ROMCU